ncbi:uncharacterized protein PHACADRAFT_214256 [Phanerochaete carnosa HHB-10118-sp]|uniref:Uncharacterized protein n=1 Tax=Phanerochaete carnosa (strain HHB-10118-sp) TaxID=650164 RepID=K5VT24_PHACS|nr:uncharacterized protein PHACADRAFT_214256 [Phanerochaete carnosa HHB-10118-sp]EKM49734.1 hypothetical protein PHACADRAFT_214256 [Phanerochaete carnosa HHB-10118-sp]
MPSRALSFYSRKLNDLQAKLEFLDLFENEASKRGVIRHAIPKTLIDQVGLGTLPQRLHKTYQRAFFSNWVAFYFIYKYGFNGTTVDLFHFARDLAA